jgi:hypothetical protein
MATFMALSRDCDTPQIHFAVPLQRHYSFYHVACETKHD